ncbi:DUF1707 domain-containing protein [Rhodococcus sp. X156]|uniref:DUF1707 domain-containing protein n=1 Tax=Rhodococcus sp. X156 TaxID=2499145 RepID=UPI0019D184BC|nr:DUF1707 domain-containing protein [Rhodococcus sp. X156]
MSASPDPGLMRTDDAERHDAQQVLGQHFVAGRLDYAEYQDRLNAATAARTRKDLWELFSDLPEPHPRVLGALGGPDHLGHGELAPPYWGAPAAAPAPPAPPRFPGFAAPPAGSGAYGYPVPGHGGQPSAPYGVDPRTGRPRSDKVRVTAGTLQIVLGCLGIGRFYTGHYGVGTAQLLITVLSQGTLAPLVILWGVIDGILMLTGFVSDRRGRPLR